MEALSVEWKGPEYPYNGNREYRYDEGNGGKMSWIWNKGLWLGKKILVGGAVVSSAPLFLPPLVVISVLGVALSVPYGIMLGSYACTEKLMSKLLSPPNPPLSGYGTISYEDDNGDGDGDGDEYVGYGGVGVIDMEKEEKAQMEDVKAGVEMRIELVDKGDGELGGGGIGRVSEEYGHEQGSVGLAEEGPEEVTGVNVHEKHVGEYCDEEERRPIEVSEPFGGMRKEDAEDISIERRDEEQLIDLVEGIAVVIEGDDLVDKSIEEVVTPCRETSILQINEAEGVAIVIEGDGSESINVEEVETSPQVTVILFEECRNQEIVSGTEEDELVRGTRGLLERMRDEGRDDNKEEMHGGAAVVDRDSYKSIEEMELPIEAKCAYNSNVQIKKLIEIGERSAEDVLGENEEIRESTYTRSVREDVNPTGQTGGRVIEKMSTSQLNRVTLEEILHDNAEAFDQKTQRDIAEMETTIDAKSANNSDVVMDKLTREREERSLEEVVGENEETRESRYTETVREEVNPTEEMGGRIIEKTSRLLSNRGTLEEILHDSAVPFDQETQRAIAEIGTQVEAESAYNSSVVMGKTSRDIEDRSLKEVLGENVEMREPRYTETMETVGEEVNATGEMGSIIIEEETKSMLEGGVTANKDANGKTEDSQLNSRIDTVLYTNADAREISGQHCKYSDYGTPKEREQSSRGMVFGSEYSSELSVSTSVPKAESESQVSIRKDVSVSSIESPYNEEKIWEQIRAMRTIVGYKAALHATCIEELKALYVFTGIEPPASFQDPSNLAEVNEKLQFLMSIIGVK